MSKELVFQIHHRYGRLRTGTVTINGRQLTTPAIVQTGSALGTLTPAELRASGVQAIKQDAMDYWRTGEQVADLHHLLGWPGILVTASGADKAYRWAKPRGRKAAGVNFHDPVSGQLKFYTPAAALQIQRALGADLTQGFARNADYFAPVDDLVAAAQQTGAWLADQPTVAGDLAPVVGGGLKRVRQASAAAVPATAGGYSIMGVDEAVPVEEQRRLVNEVLAMLDETKPCYLPTTGSVGQLAAMLLCGVDLIDSDLAGREAGMGNALVGYGRLHLDRERFAGDEQSLDPRCACDVCRRGVSRATIHHLLVNEQPLGERYLLIHNLFAVNHLVRAFRQMIEHGHVSTDFRDLAGGAHQ